MITEISPREVISYCRDTLGLVNDSDYPDEILLAGLLRRSAGILCPCSRAALSAAVFESLNFLDENINTLADRLDTLIDDLIVSGDLLELSDVATEDPNVLGTWVFAAPPSFVVRNSGSIFLSGVVPDQDTFLLAPLAARVIYSGCTRFIAPEPTEDLAELLTSHGLQELSEAVWLKAPKVETPENLLERFERLLADQPPCGTLGDLDILNPSQKVSYNRRRWTKTSNQTGTFIARRPQEFGSPIWCFVELSEGIPQRLLDFPLSKFRWRACDAAWHLQMAIDHCCGQPQQYTRCKTDNGIRFDFYSPLPQWSQRRLMIFGSECASKNSLFSYELPLAEADSEERFLRERLWLALRDGKEGETSK